MAGEDPGVAPAVRALVHWPALVLLGRHARLHPGGGRLLLRRGQAQRPLAAPRWRLRDLHVHLDLPALRPSQPGRPEGQGRRRGGGGRRRGLRRRRRRRRRQAVQGPGRPPLQHVQPRAAAGLLALRVLPGLRGGLRPPLPVDGEVHREEQPVRLLHLHRREHELPGVHFPADSHDAGNGRDDIPSDAAAVCGTLHGDRGAFLSPPS
mmetsp:Transcript_19752/g.62597  ORF Transcript_19752/g.62597 Transcript_19752/m.62597 type:complete len:207 (-) Transcript_19752:145-765(-)